MASQPPSPYGPGNQNSAVRPPIPSFRGKADRNFCYAQQKSRFVAITVMLCRSQNDPSALAPSQLLRNISFGLLYSWDAYCSSRELDINTVRDQLDHVSVNTTNYARPRSGQRKAKAIGTLRTRPNKTIEALVGTQGSCNLRTESLTLDHLCGGRAGASSSSCWLFERTPHNGIHNKTGRSVGST